MPRERYWTDLDGNTCEVFGEGIWVVPVPKDPKHETDADRVTRELQSLGLGRRRVYTNEMEIEV